MPKFSVIVPVYNVEEYLDECVNSVINQSFTDWELILVDDGSSDKSPEMCDKYSENDNRIKTIHKSNGGASDSRNIGLDNASGEYVMFLDSDDYYNDLNALKMLSDNIDLTDSQIVVFGCTDFNMITGKNIVSRNGYDLNLISNTTKTDVLHYFLSAKMIPGGPTIFCCSRDIIENNSIRFKVGIQCEDHDYVLSVFYYADSISALNEPFYSYRHGREGSVTSSANIKAIYGIEYTIKKWYTFCENIEDETIRKDYLNYIAFIYTTGFVVSGNMNNASRRKALKIMAKYKYIMKYGYWRKTKICKLAVSVIGMNLFSVLSAKYFSLMRVQA